MAAHRYWRLYITAAQGSGETDLTELYLRTTVGGASVATGGTAYAESEYSASYLAANAFDGSDSSSWASQPTGSAHWLAYDFGAGNTKDIVAYGIKAIFTAGVINYTPKDFQLQYSDNGTSWTTADLQAGQTGWSAGETRNYTLASTVSDAANPLDVVYLGQIFSDLDQSSSNDNTTLDIVYLAEPIGTKGTGAVTTDTTGSARQAQSTSAAGGTAIAATNTTSQAQGVTAAGLVADPDSIHTSQGQGSSGVAATTAFVDVASAQGQSASASGTPGISGVSGTGQAQGIIASAIAQDKIIFDGTSSQAQGSAAVAGTRDNWTLVDHDAIMAVYPEVSWDSKALTVGAGNHLVVGIWNASTLAPTFTVSDSANGVWEGPVVHSSNYNDADRTFHWFYSLNRDADTNNHVHVTASDLGDVQIGVFQFSSPAGVLAAFDTDTFKAPTFDTSTVITNPFTTHSIAGGVLAMGAWEYYGNDVAGHFNGSSPTTIDGGGFAQFGSDILVDPISGGTRSYTGDWNYPDRRSISVVAFKVMEAAHGGTSQGQSAAAAGEVTGAVETDSTGSSAQAQGVTVVATASTSAVGSSGQAQGSTAEVSLAGTGGAFSSQGQSIEATASVGTGSSATGSQAQSASAGGATGVDSTSVGSQGQTTQINAVVAVLVDVGTIQAQGSSGSAVARHVAVGSGSQAQGVVGQAGLRSNVTGVTRQGQSVDAAGATTVSAVGTTRQGQHVEGEARAESNQSVATGQAQSVEGVLGTATIAAGATQQGQQAGAEVGLAIDVTVDTAQAQRMGQGLSELHIVFDVSVSTGQAQGSTAIAEAPFVPQEGALTATLTFREAVQGQVDIGKPVSVIIRMEAAVDGRVEVRPEP